MFSTRPRRAYDRLTALLDDIDERLAGPAERLYFTEEAVSKWSVAQHVHHLLRVVHGVATRMQAIQDGESGGEPARLNAAGRLVMLLGRLPRGRARSPKYVLPDEAPDRDALQEFAAETRAAVERLEPHLGTLGDLDGGYKHPALGVLTAPQWLRFAGIHTAHHLAIIRDIERHLPDRTA